MMKKVLITGGTGGIGSQLVQSFRERGYDVAFTYCRSRERAFRLADKTGATAFCCDFTKREDIDTFAQALLTQFGEVDVFIHNAALSHYGLFQDTQREDYDSLFSVNFDSAYFLTKALMLPMLRKQSGSLIYITSVWGQTGASCEVLYSSTKAALIGFTKALAKELAPSGIKVNAIAPGIVDTAMLERFSAEEKKQMKEEIPTGKFTSPSEIAETALFLAECGNNITGQVIAVNGGMYL